MALDWPVPGYLAGMPDEELFRVAVAVTPSGWRLAATLFQRSHQRMNFTVWPEGAGFDPASVGLRISLYPSRRGSVGQELWNLTTLKVPTNEFWSSCGALSSQL